MGNKEAVFSAIKGGLIVSCQAFHDEPLFGSHIMARMALAVEQSGAVGIRASSVVDINEIKSTVKIPVIGLIKKEYPDSLVRMTPSEIEIELLMPCGCEIITMDATGRTRPKGKTLGDVFKPIRLKYPNQIFMADISTFEEGMHAAEIGFDCISTTMAGYTEYTKGHKLPAFDLVKRLVKSCTIPVFSEGGISTPEQLRYAIEAGAWCGVVGGAITRPQVIAKKFVDALPK